MRWLCGIAGAVLVFMVFSCATPEPEPPVEEGADDSADDASPAEASPAEADEEDAPPSEQTDEKDDSAGE